MNSFLIIAVILVMILTISLLNNRKIGFYIIRKKKKGEIFGMVNMINGLVGKQVRIRDIVLGVTYVGIIVEVEDKWLKLETVKKKGTITHVVALDSVGSIEY